MYNLSEKTKEVIENALRVKFNSCEIDTEYITGAMQEVIDVAYELGFTELAIELENDLKTEILIQYENRN